MAVEKSFSVIDFKLPPSVNNAVKNLTDRATKEIGGTLEDIWFLVFGEISPCAEKRKIKYACDLGKFKDELAAKIDGIPEDKLIEPDMQVVAPALEAAKYCVEHEELRQMFSNLISVSMNSETEFNVHLSFVDITKQMPSLDAENLAVFKGSELPIVEYRYKAADGFLVAFKNVFLGNSRKFDLSNQSISISVLQRLGLIEIDFGNHLAQDSKYEPFYLTPEYNNCKNSLNDFFNEVDVQKGITRSTPIGKRFIDVCLG